MTLETLLIVRQLLSMRLVPGLEASRWDVHLLPFNTPLPLLSSPVGSGNQKENAGKYKLLLLKCLFAKNFHLVRQPTLHRIWNQLGFAFMSVPWQFHPFVSQAQWIFRGFSSGLVYNKRVNVMKVSLRAPLSLFFFLNALKYTQLLMFVQWHYKAADERKM